MSFYAAGLPLDNHQAGLADVLGHPPLVDREFDIGPSESGPFLCKNARKFGKRVSLCVLHFSMNPYATAQSEPDSRPRKGIDRRTLAYALAAPVLMAFFVSLVVGFWILVVSVGRLFAPTTRAVPLPASQDQQQTIAAPQR
jgi:hypothetical protein